MKNKKPIDWSKKDIYEGIGRSDLRPKNRLTKAANKRFDEKFGRGKLREQDGIYELEGWSDKSVKQHLADELAINTEEVVEEMVKKFNNILHRHYAGKLDDEGMDKELNSLNKGK